MAPAKAIIAPLSVQYSSGGKNTFIFSAAGFGRPFSDGLRTLKRANTSRSFQLAQEIDEAQVSAKYTDGVLELMLPKKAATQARRITIQ